MTDPGADPVDAEKRDTAADSATEGPSATTLESWIRSMSHPSYPPGGRLPSHSPTCAGCGEENPASLKLDVVATERGVQAVHRFDGRQEGAPGIVHGGLVAAAFDDLFGFLLYRVGELAVTRTLTVEYLRPLLLGVSYTLEAHVEHRAGRRLAVSAGATDSSGARMATAQATFVVVDVAHFEQGATRPPA